MKSEALPSSIYEFVFVGGVNNSYGFVTSNAITYEVKFKPSDYLFNEPIVDDSVFEFVIQIAENPTGKRPPLDKRIAPTIAAIFNEFFQVHKRVVVYICDTSDSKATARHRKFNQWFEAFRGLAYFKLDLGVDDLDGTTYYTSLIFRADNPNTVLIIQAYKQLIDGYAGQK